jgi:hypothetical protein
MVARVAGRQALSSPRYNRRHGLNELSCQQLCMRARTPRLQHAFHTRHACFPSRDEQQLLVSMLTTQVSFCNDRRSFRDPVSGCLCLDGAARVAHSPAAVHPCNEARPRVAAPRAAGSAALWHHQRIARASSLRRTVAHAKPNPKLPERTVTIWCAKCNTKLYKVRTR